MSHQSLQEQLINSLRHIRNVYFVFILIISVSIYAHHAAIKEYELPKNEYIRLKKDIDVYILSQQNALVINDIFPHVVEEVKQALKNKMLFYFNVLSRNGIQIRYNNQTMNKLIDESCRFYVYDLGINIKHKLYEIQEMLNNYRAMALVALPANSYEPFDILNKSTEYELIDAQVEWATTDRFDLNDFIPEKPNRFTFVLLGSDNNKVSINIRAVASLINKELNKNILINQFPFFSGMWNEIKNYSPEELHDIFYTTHKQLDLNYKFEAVGIKIQIINMQPVCWALIIGFMSYITIYAFSIEKATHAYKGSQTSSNNIIVLPWIGMHKNCFSSIFSAILHLSPVYLFILEKYMGLIQSYYLYYTISAYALLIILNEIYTQKLLKNVIYMNFEG